MALVSAISFFTHIRLANNYFPALEFSNIVWVIIIALIHILSVHFILKIKEVRTDKIKETSPI